MGCSRAVTQNSYMANCVDDLPALFVSVETLQLLSNRMTNAETLSSDVWRLVYGGAKCQKTSLR